MKGMGSRKERALIERFILFIEIERRDGYVSSKALAEAFRVKKSTASGWLYKQLMRGRIQCASDKDGNTIEYRYVRAREVT
jgi:Mn-dependent DtxR family transcriptional regulator